MSWTDLLGGLSGGGAGLGRRKAASRPPQEPPVERLRPRDRPADEVGAADAETHRMMREAAEDMKRDFLQAGPAAGRGGAEDAVSKVVDIDSNIVIRAERSEGSLDDENRQAFGAERFEVRLNVLIALVAGLLIVTLWLVLQS